jgi:hypothetical protein
MTQRIFVILALLLTLAWSAEAEAQWRPRRPPPPGGFGRRPHPMGPPPARWGSPPTCTGQGGSCGLVDDLRAVSETDAGSASDGSGTEPAPQASGSASAEPAAPVPTSTAAVPYFYQYANRLHPGASCQNSSVAMLLNHYGVSITPDRITGRFGKDKAQSPAGLVEVFNTLAAEAGIPQRLRAQTKRGMSDLNRQLQSGTPTIVHGYFTGSGHVVLATGYDGSGYTVNDPAGRWSGSWKGGYGGSQSATAGQGVRYSERSFYQAVGTSDGSNYLAPWWYEVYTTE